MSHVNETTHVSSSSVFSGHSNIHNSARSLRLGTVPDAFLWSCHLSMRKKISGDDQMISDDPISFYQIAFFSSLPSQSLFHPMIPRLLHSPTCTRWNHHEHFIDRHRRYFPTSPKPRSKSQQFQAWHVKWNRSSLWTSSMYVFTISMYLALLQVFWKTTWNLNLSLCHDVHRLKATQLAGAVLSLPSEVCKAAHDCGVGDGREHETACVGKEDQVERHNSARRIGATATPKQLQHQPTSDSQNC